MLAFKQKKMPRTSTTAMAAVSAIESDRWNIGMPISTPMVYGISQNNHTQMFRHGSRR